MLSIETISDQYGTSVAVMIQACRVHVGTATIKELDDLIKKTEINWQELALLSRLHRIRPVVFRTLLSSMAPAPFKEKLKKELHVNTLLNFSIASETTRLVDQLAKAGIEAIPYKGVAYSKQFYQDLSMRESSDIDLVIQASDLEKTIPVFEKEGYKLFNSNRYHWLGLKEYCIEEKDLCFGKTSSTGQLFHVELHFKITHPRFGCPENVNRFDLSHTTASELNQGDAKFLSPGEHFRAVMLHHLLHDGLEYLKIFVDLATGLQKLIAVAAEAPMENNIKNPEEKSEARVIFESEETVSNKDIVEKAIASLEKVYHTNIIFLVMEELLGIGSIAVKNKTKPEQEAARYFLHFNLNATVGRYKRHRIFSLLNHYRRTIANRAALIRDKNQKNSFKQRYWINLIMPQQADQEAVPLPRYLTPFYFIIRPIRILLRKKSDP